MPTAGKGKWHVGRVPAAEDLLVSLPLSPSALAGALEAVVRHVEAAGADAYTVQCAEGVLFSALAPRVSQVRVALHAFHPPGDLAYVSPLNFTSSVSRETAVCVVGNGSEASARGAL